MIFYIDWLLWTLTLCISIVLGYNLKASLNCTVSDISSMVTAIHNCYKCEFSEWNRPVRSVHASENAPPPFLKAFLDLVSNCHIVNIRFPRQCV